MYGGGNELLCVCVVSCVGHPYHLHVLCITLWFQFADPTHAAAQRIGWPASQQQLQGVPFFAKDGFVYASFKDGEKPTLEEVRQRELTERVFRSGEEMEEVYGRRRRLMSGGSAVSSSTKEESGEEVVKRAAELKQEGGEGERRREGGEGGERKREGGEGGDRRREGD
jgi:hypothetical protein